MISETFCTYIALPTDDDMSDSVEASGDPVWRTRGDALLDVLRCYPDGLRMRELRAALLEPQHRDACRPFRVVYRRPRPTTQSPGHVRWLLVLEATYWLWIEGLVHRDREGRFHCVSPAC